VRAGSANVDERPTYAALYGVRSVPTLLLVDALGVPVADLTPLVGKKERPAGARR
jgi:thioredoxin-like negative regulator of GroEL